MIPSFKIYLQRLSLLCVTALLMGISSGVEAFATGKAVASEVFPFVENQGQLVDSRGNPVPDVLYYSHVGRVSIYLKRDGFSYVFHDAPPTAKIDSEAREAAIAKGHRVDFRLEGSLSTSTVESGRISPDYSNFYLEHCPNGIMGVRAVDRVTFKNVYPDIDLHFYADASGIKYDFVIHGGGDPSLIKIRIVGAEDILWVTSNTIALQTSVGPVEEILPESYATKSYGSGQKRKVRSAYRQAGNLFFFEVESPKEGETLVIDPLSTWATFFGGNGFDYGEGVVHSNDGVYMAGSTTSTTYPFTVGAFQTTLAGGYDAHLTKFDLTGNRLWATYYGGTGEDRGTEIDYDASSDMVYVTGYCSNSFPTSPGAHQTLYGGGTYDAFLLKFDATGTRQWGTLMGGDDEDRSEGVAVDPFGNVSISGRTASSSAGSISTAGVVQVARSGSFDSYISKFDATGVRQWGSYIGGTSQDYGHSITCDAAGNIIIVGETYSNNFPAGASAGNTAFLTVKPGAFGDIDFFVYKISPTGTTRVWATYYGGANVERGWGVTTDASDNVLACGNAFAAFPVTAGVIQPVYGTGTGDGALVKFSSTGSRMFATYLGGTSYDCAFSVDVTPSNTIVVIGETQSGWTVLNNCATGCGGADFCGFVVHLNATASSRIMSTKIGGTNSFNSTLDLTVDGSDNIYLCGYTNSTDFPVGGTVVFQPAYGGGSSDAYLGIINDDSCDAVVLSAARIELAGQWLGQGASLVWRYGDEEAQGRWWVGRSWDGSNFDYALVSPAITSQGYQWFDAFYAPADAEHVFYKIRHWDSNGSEVESDAIQLSTTGRNPGILYYPVPARDVLYIQHPLGEPLSEVEVFSLSGRLLLQSSAFTTGLDISSLPGGLYGLRVLTVAGEAHHTLFTVARQ